MKHTVKWGIVGLGNIALEFAKSFYNVENADLIAVASTSNEKLIKYKQQFNIIDKNLYHYYEGILENEEIDVVYIALPNSFHFEWILKALEKKKNIFVEKPAFINLSEAKTIFNHENFKDSFFGEGYMYRYHPQIIDMIKIIKSGEIGKPISMNTNFGMNLIFKKNLFGFRRKKINKDKRIFNKSLGGGVILDQGCYTTSMSLLVASLIENIDTSNFNLSNIKTEYMEGNIDVHSQAEINFDNKFLSNVTTSFTENIGKETIILCEKGKIVIQDSWNSKDTKIQVIGNTDKIFKFKDIKNTYSLEIENISNDILNNRYEASEPGMSKKDILLNSKLINHWMNEKK